MHIQNQLCGMAIMVMLLYMFLRQKRIGLYSEWVFLRTLGVTMISVSLDILSLVAIAYRDLIPKLLLDSVCKSYVVSLIWVGALAFMYIVLDLYSEKVYRQHVKRVSGLALVESVVVYVLPIHYYVDAKSVYTEGPSVLMTYIFALSFVVATVYMIVRFGKKIEKKRRLAAIMWMTLWIVTSMIQFLNNELLLVGFACSLGMLALYCILENPENNIDHKYGCFRNHALISYLAQCYGRNESRAVLFLSFNSKQRKNFTPEYIDQCMCDLIQWLNANTKALIFHNVGCELAVVFEDMSQMSLAFSDIQENFYFDQFYNMEETDSAGHKKKCYDLAGEKEFPETLFILFPDTQIVNGVDEVMEIHQTIHAENHNLTRSLVCYVDNKILEQIRQKDQMVGEILKALDEDRVEVFFQPIYSVKEKSFVSAEALVRIRNTDGSILAPGQFIPVAEESGLITRLGERVFEKVCIFLRDNDPEKLGIHYLEVNLSVLQCEQNNLSRRYLDIMHDYGTNPWYINLEITETATLNAKNTLLKNMNQLIEKGVSFSLDDFGNGQSNLDYMIDMPVSVMKLDMNMTQSYFTDMKARVVVQSAVKLAHELDLFIVAEGVETKAQLEEMIALGVDYIQGYYFSKPVPTDEYLRFIDSSANETQAR